ncbi:MAG: hypothetical protein IJ206_03745 [Oscillospiraceae bacterium]|nr:hypothetical protein [Oscillospiraceae bacterium]
MEYIEANPLPEVCLTCTEPDCDVCDHGRERWLLSPENETALKLKLFRQGLKRKSTAYLLAILWREMDAVNTERIDTLVEELGTRGEPLSY